MTRPSTPSWLRASVRPLLARELNERSFRPPMSVTSPTRIFLPAGLADEEDEVLLEDFELLESSEPQPAATSAVAAKPSAATRLREMDHVSKPSFGSGVPASRAGGGPPRSPAARGA